jgi:V-type H+-transporting ATPase subunit A
MTESKDRWKRYRPWEKTIYIPRGIDVPSLNRENLWDYKPGTSRVEDHITGGDIWRSVLENNLLSDHKIMLPPRARGQITRIAEAGSYTVTEKPFVVKFNGKTTEYTTIHIWPVRVSRPVTERLGCDAPLLT